MTQELVPDSSFSRHIIAWNESLLLVAITLWSRCVVCCNAGEVLNLDIVLWWCAASEHQRYTEYVAPRPECYMSAGDADSHLVGFKVSHPSSPCKVNPFLSPSDPLISPSYIPCLSVSFPHSFSTPTTSSLCHFLFLHDIFIFRLHLLFHPS